MRMWMIDTKLMCNSHLLGEHGEIHKHKHNFEKRHNMFGRLSPIVQIVPDKMQERHDEVAREMLSRGMNHKSPYSQPDVSYLPSGLKVDMEYNLHDLATRCPECAKLIGDKK